MARRVPARTKGRAAGLARRRWASETRRLGSLVRRPGQHLGVSREEGN
jgi:hypothetical protein